MAAAPTGSAGAKGRKDKIENLSLSDEKVAALEMEAALLREATIKENAHTWVQKYKKVDEETKKAKMR